MPFCNRTVQSQFQKRFTWSLVACTGAILPAFGLRLFGRGRSWKRPSLEIGTHASRCFKPSSLLGRSDFGSLRWCRWPLARTALGYCARFIGRHADNCALIMPAYMRLAIAQAQKVPELPFGAIIVDSHTEAVLAEGHNRSKESPTFHGEIDVINRLAAKQSVADWCRWCCTQRPSRVRCANQRSNGRASAWWSTARRSPS